MNNFSAEINHAIEVFLERNNFQKTLNIFKSQLKNNRHGQLNHVNVSQEVIYF